VVKQGKIDQHVDEEPRGRAEQQHQPAAHRGTHEQTQVSAGRTQPDRALQLSGSHDVVDQELAGGAPYDPGHSVHREQDHRVPHLDRIGEEQQAPGE